MEKKKKKKPLYTKKPTRDSPNYTGFLVNISTPIT